MDYYQTFLNYLKSADKKNSVTYALSLLEENKVNIVDLYENILAKALNQINQHDDKTSIWEEHTQTAIIRTIIESSYKYVLKALEQLKVQINERVIVLCPEEEYHELGARMVTDFFMLVGYQTLFVGANTPKDEIIALIDEVKPKYVAISVTNYFHLVKTKQIIEEIRAMSKTQIIVGGQAVKSGRNVSDLLQPDLIIQSYEEIQNLARGEKHVSST